MAYFFVDPDGLQTMIDNLNSYATSTETSRSDVVLANTFNSHKGETPVDLSSFSSNLVEYKGELESKARGLAYRLEAARAANETGMTVTAPDGRISYYVPDDKADNADNIKSYNNVDTWKQAKTDTATMVDYSENGCTLEEWEALVARMREYQDNPAYANTITNTIGPAKMQDCVIGIQEQFPENADVRSKGYVPSYAPNAGEDLAEVFGHVIATASNTWDDSKAEEYANRLVDATREDGKPERIYALNAMLSASQNADIDGDGSPETIGLDYNDALLTTLSSRLEGLKYGSVSRSESQLVRSMYDKDEDINPLSGVAHAMTGNPEASTTWLTVYNEDGSVDSEATVERTKKLVEKYPIGENSWTDDWTLIAAQNAILDQENGDGLEQVSIVSGILDHIGKNKDNELSITDAAINGVGITLACYPYGVQQSAVMTGAGGSDATINGLSNKGSWNVNLPPQPWMSNAVLCNLIGQVSKDDTALARLAYSQEMFNNEQVAGEASLTQSGGDSVHLNTALMNQSKTRGFIAGAIAKQCSIDATSEDERVGAWANAASIAVNAVPVPQVKAGTTALRLASEFAINAGKAAAAEGAKEGLSSLYGDAVTEQADQNLTTKYISQGVDNAATTLAVLNSGLYSQTELQMFAEDVTGEESVINPDGTLSVGTNVTTLTPEQVKQLIYIGSQLPADGKAVKSDFDTDSGTEFDKGYEAANPSARTADQRNEN